jgi:hypothetical protein
MPITPYHFGPSGLLGLLFRRWIDPVVFVAANIVVDVEVLVSFFNLSIAWAHRVWHVHTLLVGGIVGGIFGLACWDIRPVRRRIERLARAMRIPYTASARGMILGGALGIWLHVLIDSLYHFDVQALWPWPYNPFFRMWNVFYTEPRIPHWIRVGCLVCFVPAVIVWRWIVVRSKRQSKPHP